MSNKSKKRLREEAVRAEIRRREAKRAEKSPINKNEMISLIEFVGKSIMEKNHENDFQFTEKWASVNSIDFESLKTYLEGEKIKDDWGLLIEGDPYAMFGGSESRLMWMPLEKVELEELLEWLEIKLEQNGCNHNYQLTSEWLVSKEKDVNTVLAALMAKGGGCDCEVIYNVDPENIYPKNGLTNSCS